MSIFDNRPPGHLDILHAGLRLMDDYRLITAYQKEIEGVGLETLEQDPAHQLIQQALKERYKGYEQLGQGNEGFWLTAAVVAGGYVAYKKLMRSKNNPVLKKTAEAEKNVEKTYNADWLNSREPVNKLLKVSYLSEFMASPEFDAFLPVISVGAETLLKSVNDVVDKAAAAWKKIEPIARDWLNAKSEEEQQELHGQLRALYPESPYLTLGSELKFIPRNKSSAGHNFDSLSKDQYGKAVELLKKLVEAFDKVDDLSETLWQDLGLWDEFNQARGDWPGADDFWDYAAGENINDYFGRSLFSARCELLDLARGLEEWIVKSFK